MAQYVPKMLQSVKLVVFILTSLEVDRYMLVALIQISLRVGMLMFVVLIQILLQDRKTNSLDLTFVV